MPRRKIEVERRTIQFHFTLLIFLAFLGGCTHCSTVQYDTAIPTTTKQGASFKTSPSLISRDLVQSEQIVVGSVVVADAYATLERVIKYGGSTGPKNWRMSSQALYTEFVHRSTVPAWTPSNEQLRDLRHAESLLLRQPNIFECLGILLCRRSFPRESSKEFLLYQDTRAQLASLNDQLNLCEAGHLDCDHERKKYVAKKRSWDENENRRMIESALSLREEIIAEDPELRKISAIERLEQFRNSLGIPSENSSDELLRWSSDRLSVESIPGFPSTGVTPHTFFVRVRQGWFDQEYLDSGNASIPSDQLAYLPDSVLFIPVYLSLSESRNDDGTENLAITGVLGIEVHVQ